MLAPNLAVCNSLICSVLGTLVNLTKYNVNYYLNYSSDWLDVLETQNIWSNLVKYRVHSHWRDQKSLELLQSVSLFVWSYLINELIWVNCLPAIRTTELVYTNWLSFVLNLARFRSWSRYHYTSMVCVIYSTLIYHYTFMVYVIYSTLIYRYTFMVCVIYSTLIYHYTSMVCVIYSTLIYHYTFMIMRTLITLL